VIQEEARSHKKRQKKSFMVKFGNFFQIQVNHELRFLGRIVTWLKRSYEEIHSNQKEFLWMVIFGKTGVTRKTEVQ